MASDPAPAGGPRGAAETRLGHAADGSAREVTPPAADQGGERATTDLFAEGYVDRLSAPVPARPQLQPATGQTPQAAGAPAATAKAQPHHTGHRGRLRARFSSAGPQALADYELMELLLFRAIPRRDCKPLAKELLNRFGSISEVISAPKDRLMEVPGVSESVATDLHIVRAAALCLLRDAAVERRHLGSWQEVLDYLRAAMAYETREEFRILFLDKRNAIIADEVQQRGTVDHTPVYVREVVRRALEVSATALILVHNHPSGDPAPSRADISMTSKIIEAAEPLGIVVHDHIIMGRSGHVSMRAEGLLTKP